MKRPKKPEKKSILSLRNPLVVACLVVASVAVAVLLSAGGEPEIEGAVNPSLGAFFQAVGIKRRGVDVFCTSETACLLRAKQNINRGDVVMRIPLEMILDPRAIVSSESGKLIAENNGSAMMRFTTQKSLGQAFPNVFPYAFFLSLEKKNPSSKFAQYLSALPRLDQLRGSMFWDPSYDVCLDQSTAREAAAVRSLHEGSVELASEFCAERPEACPHGAPTSDEIKWALGVYFSRNHQDRALLIGMDFAQWNNSRPGLSVQYNEAEHALDITAGDVIERGEPLNVNHLRGPSIQLVTHGLFDPSTRGIDAGIRPQEDSKDPLAKKLCSAKIHDLMFLGTGRPREALVNCVAALVANKEQRTNFKKNLRTDRLLQRYTYGNLTAVLQNLLQGFEGLEEHHELCSKEGDPVLEVMREYVAYAKSLFLKNFDYCKERYDQLTPESERELEEEDAPEPAERATESSHDNN